MYCTLKSAKLRQLSNAKPRFATITFNNVMNNYLTRAFASEPKRIFRKRIKHQDSTITETPKDTEEDDKTLEKSLERVQSAISKRLKPKTLPKTTPEQDKAVDNILSSLRKPKLVQRLSVSDKREKPEKRNTESLAEAFANEEQSFVLTKSGKRISIVDAESQHLETPKKTYDTLWYNFTEGAIVMPKELASRMKASLEGFSRKLLRDEATKLSEILRMRTTSLERQRALNPSLPKAQVEKKEGPLKMREKELVVNPLSIPLPPVYTENQALAYIIHRMPGVYGCTHRVFTEVKRLLPEFQPKTMLDFGSGPGTAIWSATQTWEKQIKNILAVEPSSAMTKASERILQGFPVQRRRYLFSNLNIEPYDLVTASYVLSELKNEEERTAIIRNLWNSTGPGGVLVLVEPGTPVGFEIIKNARSQLLNFHIFDHVEDIQVEDVEGQMQIQETDKPAYSAQLVAPCPHAYNCPMSGKSWCHFPQRIERIPLQKSAKPHLTVNYEDEKFSYLVLRKVDHGQPQTAFPTEVKLAKVTAPPLKRTGHVILDVCASSGSLERHVIAKSKGQDLFTVSRKSEWGDSLLMGSFPEGTVKKVRNANDTLATQGKKALEEYQNQLKILEEQRKQEEQTLLQNAPDFVPKISPYSKPLPKPTPQPPTNALEPADELEIALSQPSGVSKEHRDIIKQIQEMKQEEKPKKRVKIIKEE